MSHVSRGAVLPPAAIGIVLGWTAWWLAAEIGCAEESFTPLPLGTTALAELVHYRVGFQQDGAAEHQMPPSWMGRFETPPRIAFVPSDRVMDRNAIMMHPPWADGTGTIWVDYPVRLPAGVPVTLQFAMGMRDEELAPGKSDGVTFECILLGDGEPRTVFRDHDRRSGWQEVEVDLSTAAGTDVTIRLVVDPGPDRNSTSDTAYLGEPRITCGTDREPPAGDRRGRMAATGALRAATTRDIGQVMNDPASGVLPSNAVPYRTWVERTAAGYALAYEGADGRVTWRYKPATGTLDDFVVQFDDEAAFSPAATGGVYAGTAPDEVRLEGGHAETVSADDDSLRVLWTYPGAGEPIEVEWRFRLHGKALVVEARSASHGIGCLSLGESRGVALRRRIQVPYLHRFVDYLPREQIFALRFFDWTRSHASKSPEHKAIYATTTAGERNPLQETGCIAVSRNVHEVLPNIPHPASPNREMLAPLIVLDLWGHMKGSYAGDTEHLLELKDNGVDHMAIIQHDWQRFGYDVKLPDHVPANPQFGTEAELATFGSTATRLGYLWALHENYIDIYPDAPSWDPTAVVLQADGEQSQAWFNPGTRVQSYGIKCNRALEFAKRTAPEAHRRYGTTAGYLDVHTGVPPWHQLDHDASQPMAAMALHKVERDAELFAYLREAHAGPLLGEGHQVLYWAGLFDGAEAQVEGGEEHAPLVDFELLKIHPQLVNHGMGYYVRWYRRGWGSRWGVDTGTPAQLDKYRAQQIAYGHAGFVGRELTPHVAFIVKEHHLMHPIQRLMAAARPTAIEYWIDGEWVTASVALAAGICDRQRIRYDRGLTVWVNWRDEPWQIEGRVLPQWGFLALGPDTEVWTALLDGRYADYAACPEFVYVDSRTRFGMPVASAEEATADFSSHTNPPGSSIEAGGVSTDGAVKVHRENGGLVVFPYPRDTPFSVTLDLDRLGGRGAFVGPIAVTALEARTGRELGPVTVERSGPRITFTTGVPGAGRYRIAPGSATP